VHAIATYSGWRLHGVAGGMIAGLLFVLPGALVILLLAALYANFGSLPLVHFIFLGIKSAVLIIVLEALLKVSKRALIRPHYYGIAALAFIGIFFFNLPYPLIVIVAALIGLVTSQDKTTTRQTYEPGPDHLRTLSTIVLWLTVWWTPVLLLWWFGADQILIELSVFFSKLAVVTFGGAYAVLAYMAQDVVSANGWLTAQEMIDGLGLAETTPGPLILVTEFVGFLTVEKQGGFWLATFAALTVLWVTFIPCFLWIFAGAPYIERISAQPRLQGALAAITAAVVGVILNLTIWFTLNVLFSDISTLQWGAVKILVPVMESLDWRAPLIALIAAVALIGVRWNMLLVLLISAICGLALSVF